MPVTNSFIRSSSFSQANVSQAEYERAHREYLMRLQSSLDEQTFGSKKMLHVFPATGNQKCLIACRDILLRSRIVSTLASVRENSQSLGTQNIVRSFWKNIHAHAIITTCVNIEPPSFRQFGNVEVLPDVSGINPYRTNRDYQFFALTC